MPSYMLPSIKKDSNIFGLCMYIYMLNKNTLGVKKGRGQEEAAL